jgi:hypothetical protein
MELTSQNGFEVLGLTCPQAEADWYRAQRNAESDVNVGRTAAGNSTLHAESLLR